MGQQEQTPPQLLAMVDDQLDSLVMPYHHENDFFTIPDVKESNCEFMDQGLISFFVFFKLYIYAGTPLKGVCSFKFADSLLQTDPGYPIRAQEVLFPGMFGDVAKL